MLPGRKATPSVRSMAGTMTSMLKATSRPSATPARVPMMPLARALHDEDAHDRARAGAQRAQDGDVGALVGHRHHQRRHQVEGGHRDDQRQDDEHQPLLDLHRVEPVAVGARPVAHHQARRQGRLQFARRRAAPACTSASRSCTPVAPPVRNRRAASSRWISARRAVVLVVAGVEGADHGERLQPRHHAGRRDLAAGARRASPCRRRARRAGAPARRRARCASRRAAAGANSAACAAPPAA